MPAPYRRGVNGVRLKNGRFMPVRGGASENDSLTMPLPMHRTLAALVFALVLAPTARAADDVSPVQVRLPAGFSAPLPSVRPASTTTKLLVIGFLRVANRSRFSVLDIEYARFALVADDGASYAVSPLTKKLADSLPETTLPPGQSETGTLAFEVPRDLPRATLVFCAAQYDVDYPSY